MTKFQTLFGIDEKDIKKTCILMPILIKDALKKFGIKELKKGKLYSSNSNKTTTLIQTGVGPALLGDAVLYLADTACQDIILFGSCGLVAEEKGLTIGSLVAPAKCYALESFTDMLLQRCKGGLNIPYRCGDLTERFLMSAKSRNIKKVCCATLGSLKLEEDIVETFKEKEVEVVDMECSAFFSSAKEADKNPLALFYVTDIINKKPFYSALTDEDRATLSASIKSALDILWSFTETLGQ